MQKKMNKTIWKQIRAIRTTKDIIRQTTLHAVSMMVKSRSGVIGPIDDNSDTEMNTLQHRDDSTRYTPNEHRIRPLTPTCQRECRYGPHLSSYSQRSCSARVERVSRPVRGRACFSARCTLQATRVHPVNTQVDACLTETIVPN